MSRQMWTETLAWSATSGVAVANSAAETILFPNITVPNNYMQGGRILRFRAFGAYGTTGTPAITFAVRWGGIAGTVLAKTAAAVLTSGVGGGASMTATWSLEYLMQTKADGSAGSLLTMGELILYTSTLPTAGTVTNYGMPMPLVSGATGGTTPVPVTVDLTVDTALALTVLWGAANPANSIQGLAPWLESMN